MNQLYHNEKWLKEQYENTKSIYRMAEIANCHYRTIHKWMNKYKIPMHGMKGQKKSPESIKKSVESRKGKPGSMTGKHHSEETRQRMSENRRGAQNGNWKGGITNKIRKFRRSKEYIRWRNEVINRAKGKCEKCGQRLPLEAHHIISLHKNISLGLEISNGQALCHACHLKEDGKL